jgi:hypothetical protein
VQIENDVLRWKTFLPLIREIYHVDINKRMRGIYKGRVCIYKENNKEKKAILPKIYEMTAFNYAPVVSKMTNRIVKIKEKESIIKEKESFIMVINKE